MCRTWLVAVAIRIENVYDVTMPSDVRRILSCMSYVVSVGVDGIPLSCLGTDGYVSRLTFYMCACMPSTVASSLHERPPLCGCGALPAHRFRTAMCPSHLHAPLTRVCVPNTGIA